MSKFSFSQPPVKKEPAPAVKVASEPSETVESNVVKMRRSLSAPALGKQAQLAPQLATQIATQFAPHSSPRLNAALTPPTNPRASAALTLGIAQHAFNLESPTLPPGSHYPEWVWNACENLSTSRPHTTIELYVDSLGNSGQGGQGVDLRHHCLIDLEHESLSMPWEHARRVLLVPVAYKQDINQRDRRQQRGASDQPRDALAVANWLANGFDQMSVMGRCAIAQRESGEELEYWVIVSVEDAQKIEQSLRSTADVSRFGLQAMQPSSRGHVNVQGNSQGNSNFKTFGASPSVPPTQRYLGAWRGEQAQRALSLAQAKSGPVPIGEWEQSERAILLGEHAALGASASARAATTIPAKDLIVMRDEDPQEGNRAPKRARMRG